MKIVKRFDGYTHLIMAPHWIAQFIIAAGMELIGSEYYENWSIFFAFALFLVWFVVFFKVKIKNNRLRTKDE